MNQETSTCSPPFNPNRGADTPGSTYLKLWKLIQGGKARLMRSTEETNLSSDMEHRPTHVSLTSGRARNIDTRRHNELFILHRTAFSKPRTANICLFHAILARVARSYDSPIWHPSHTNTKLSIIFEKLVLNLRTKLCLTIEVRLFKVTISHSSRFT